MTLRILLLFVSLLLGSSAWAHNCPSLLAELDEVLAAKPDVDEETIVDEDLNRSVRALRDEGEQLHDAGKHSESIEVLERALNLLEEVAG